MKTCFSVCLALLALVSAHAQMLRPQAVNGAVLGGVAGAIIGNNSGDLRHNAWRGAAIGAGAGLLLGTLAADAEDRRTATQVPVPDAARTYVYRTPPTYVYAEDEAAYVRPNYAGRGLLWGGLIGAVIGNNSGDLRHNAWRGAAYGAAAGYLLGAIAENHAREREAALAAAPAAPAPAPAETAATPPAAAAPAQPKPAPSSMAAANSLFGRE